MTDLLRDPIWQGIGVVVTIALGFVGFYYAGRHKFWLYLSGALAITIIGIAIGSWIERSNATRLLSTTTPIAIDSTKGWQSTGIFIVRGDMVRVRVTGGNWTPWRDKFPDEFKGQLPDEVKQMQPKQIWIDRSEENDGSGVSQSCSAASGGSPDCPLPQFYSSALVAQIGNTKYGIGNSCTFFSESDGELQLRINDTALIDNAGILAVEIVIGQQSTNSNTLECGEAVR